MKVKGIARYAHVMSPSSKYDKYSINLLIHKSDPECASVEKAISETINNTHPSKIPKNFKNCWKDLAVEEPENESLADYMCLTASPTANAGKTPVVDQDIKPIIDPGYTINGQYVWIDGTPWVYNNESNGIKFILNGTCVLNEKGPLDIGLLSNKPSVEQMFSDVVRVEPETPITPSF